jgi:Maltokinase N-terminal cap domain
MALLHQAELRPSKLELLAGWLPSRPWYPGPAGPELTRVVSYRFDDPAGAVGIETILVRAGDGALLQAPLTYRGAPLDGPERWLVGTMDHSVLGRRWVYDACGDPVYARVLAHTMFTGAGQADEFVDMAGGLVRREPASSVNGSGTPDAAVPAIGALLAVDDDNPTVIRTDTVELVVARVLDGAGGLPAAAHPALTGTWDGQATPLVLAYARSSTLDT